MKKPTRPSRPFSNGSECGFFYETFCDLCDRYKLDESGDALPDNCEIENAIARATIDDTQWPQNDIVAVGDCSHFCTKFTCSDDEIMKEYRELFEEADHET